MDSLCIMEYSCNIKSVWYVNLPVIKPNNFRNDSVCIALTSDWSGMRLSIGFVFLWKIRMAYRLSIHDLEKNVGQTLHTCPRARTLNPSIYAHPPTHVPRTHRSTMWRRTHSRTQPSTHPPAHPATLSLTPVWMFVISKMLCNGFHQMRMMGQGITH